MTQHIANRQSQRSFASFGMRAGSFSWIFEKKMWIILALGFASGLPLGLTATTLQAWYAASDLSMTTIGFLALIGQPYVYKFLWSPLCDKYRLPRFGLRRGWLLATQLGLIAGLLVMAMLSPKSQPYWLGFVGLCVAILSATQDIATDAYRTEILAAPERGVGTGMAVTGYRIAMLVSSGLSLILASLWGFSATYVAMAALMGIGIVATLLCDEPQHYRAEPPTFWQACVLPFKEFLSRPQALLLLALVVFYKLGDAFAVSLTTPFLLKGVGFSLKTIGVVNKSLGMIATLLGVFTGGVLLMRLGLFRALFIFGILQALTNLLFYALAIVGNDMTLFILAVGLDNFGGGLGTAAFMALVMSLCNPQFTATQFALISALAAVGRVYVGPLAGWLVDTIGWAQFYVWTVVFAVPGMLLLWWLRDTITLYDKEGIEGVLAHTAAKNVQAPASV